MYFAKLVDTPGIAFKSVRLLGRSWNSHFPGIASCVSLLRFTTPALRIIDEEGGTNEGAWQERRNLVKSTQDVVTSFST